MVFDLAKIARPNVLGLEPYRCARDDFKEGILLDANENTHGASVSDMTDYERGLELNRYPDPHQIQLKKQICDYRNSQREGGNLAPENLCLGVGSDESIDALMRCCITPGVEKMIICPPTYGMYSVCAVVNDVGLVKVPLNLDTFDIDPSAILAALEKDQSIKLVYVTSPGNPTGKKIDEGLLLELLQGVDKLQWNGLVVIDEAYIDFAPKGSSVCTLVNQYPNLVVFQTLSKAFGLAGIRLGITFADKRVSRLMNSMKYPYNISNLASDVAIRATTKESLEQMEAKVASIIEQRGIVLSKLQALSNIGRNLGGLDSNFILLEVLDKEGKPSNDVAYDVYNKLASERNVVVRFRGKELGCNGCLRVTIGTKEENEKLVEQFESVLDEVLN